MLAGERRGGTVRLAAGPTFADAGADGPVAVVVRPEDVRLGADDADVRVAGRLADAVFLGPYTRYRIALDGGEEIVVHASGGGGAARGSAVTVGWTAAAQRVVDGS